MRSGKDLKYHKKIDVTSVKYLKQVERLRPGVKAISIIPRVPEQEAAKLGPRVLFMGKFKELVIV